VGAIRDREKKSQLALWNTRTFVASRAARLFPDAAKAVGEYKNAWLAGSPLGQVDIVQIDRTTVVEDLHTYRAIAYADGTA
jgi:hypothetical protein